MFLADSLEISHEFMLKADDRVVYDRFGCSVSISEETAIFETNQDDDRNESYGPEQPMPLA